MSEDQAIFAPKGKVVLRRVAGEVLLVPIRGSVADMERLYVLEGIGEDVWARLDGKRSVADLTTDLMDEFEASADELRADIEAFLADLKAADLIQELQHV